MSALLCSAYPLTDESLLFSSLLRFFYPRLPQSSKQVSGKSVQKHVSHILRTAARADKQAPASGAGEDLLPEGTLSLCRSYQQVKEQREASTATEQAERAEAEAVLRQAALNTEGCNTRNQQQAAGQNMGQSEGQTAGQEGRGTDQASDAREPPTSPHARGSDNEEPQTPHHRRRSRRVAELAEVLRAVRPAREERDPWRVVEDMQRRQQDMFERMLAVSFLWRVVGSG